MQTKITIDAKGKVIAGGDKIKDIFSSCEAGEYLVSVRGLSSLSSPRDCQSAYFSMVDTIAMHAGETRYDLHERFKTDENIGTTKDLTSEQWLEVLAKFRWWAFNNYDCIV